jgi:septal ring factor EnvC (AmiA/AmiB activator)
MKQKYLICFLLFAGLTGLCMAQRTQTLNDSVVSNMRINFNKLETEFTKVQNELKQLEQQRKQLLDLMSNFNDQQKRVMERVDKLEKRYDGMASKIVGTNANPKSDSQPQLLDATKQMQETQMSFNLQYLQLQSQMQHENRSYTAVSNIMKTKHDTVKNSISNVR